MCFCRVSITLSAFCFGRTLLSSAITFPIQTADRPVYRFGESKSQTTRSKQNKFHIISYEYGGTAFYRAYNANGIFGLSQSRVEALQKQKFVMNWIRIDTYCGNEQLKMQNS